MSLMTFASRNAIFSVPIVVTYFNSFGTIVKSETLKVGKFERLYAGELMRSQTLTACATA